MPNTLVHMGVQAFGTKLIAPKVDLKWIVLGCIIPDLPWIFRRIINGSGIHVDVYDLQLYTIVQASLLFCLVLSLAFSLVSERPRFVFIILAVNSVFHLLLDSVEIKWGNGVHLLAPFSWQYLSFEIMWTDSRVMLGLTIVGTVVFVRYAMATVQNPVRINLTHIPRLMAVVLLLVVYLLAPLAFLHGPYSSDINSIATLKEVEERIGRNFYMDRGVYIKRAEQDIVLTFANEQLRVIGDVRANSSSTVTIKALFVETDAIEIQELHQVRHHWRDFASLVGLALAGIYCLVRLVREAHLKI